MLQGRFGPAGCGFCVVTSEICVVDEGEPKAECVFTEKVSIFTICSKSI